jgi:hypothetical protein
MFIFTFILLPHPGLASFTNGAALEIPFDNTTALNHDIVTSWVSSPNQRGTCDILYSCVVTITLCIFTVLHLNIPAYREKHWKQYRRKFKWMFIAIIVPEFVLFMAYTQFQGARQVRDSLNSPSKRSGKIVRARL